MALSAKKEDMPLFKRNSHMLSRLARTAAILALPALLLACGDKKQTTSEQPAKPAAEEKLAPLPGFSEDSAYAFVTKQVAFGPRVPNTAAHKACRAWMVARLKSFGWEVMEQNYSLKAFDGKQLELTNIIASYNPGAAKRLMFAAHWDTRPFADQDNERQNEPIDGANDGGSGVGVLMELARAISAADSAGRPSVGIDLVFFDGEDYGAPDDYEGNLGNDPAQWWCMGSRYWAENKHKPGYSAYYGVLLDMVGNKGARFAKEGVSMQFAPSVVERVWGLASRLGYGDRFINLQTEAITDDHVNVNLKGHINMIDIIEYDPSDEAYFSNTWHTHADNMENIDKGTLKAVTHTLLQLIYQESQPVQ